MKKRLARSLRDSSIEPDTSITQNITARVEGTGTRTRLRNFRSSGSRKGTRAMWPFRNLIRSSRSALCLSVTSSFAPCCSSSASASSASRSSLRLSALSAMRRPSAPRIERTMLRLLGVPSLTKPARCDLYSGISASCVRVRLGNARSSKNACMNSSLVRWKTKSSSPSPESLAWLPPLPPPPPPSGRLMRSPVTYSLLPGCTASRLPPWPWPNTGWLRSRLGMWTSSPCSRSRMPRPSTARRTASRICCLCRRRKRSRLPTDLFLPDSRRSMICWSMCVNAVGAVGAAIPTLEADSRRTSVRTTVRSRTLADAQVPLAEQTNLLRRVALLHHPVDEVLVLARLVGARLRVEADDRQQLLGVGEHLLLDDHAQLFVARPQRVLARVLRAGPQDEVDDLVAEDLRIGEALRLFDLLERGVQRAAVEHLAGVGVAVLLVLDPVVGVGDVAVEDVLAVLRIALEIRGLDLLADELSVARRQVLLDERDVLLLGLAGELLALDLLLEHVHQVHRVGGHLLAVEVEDLGQDLVREARGDAAHAFVDAGVVAVLLVALGARVGVLEILAVVHQHLPIETGV